MFARIIQVGCVMMRVKVGHTADVKNLVADLGEFKPTFILAVPRVFEKVFNTASQTAHAAGKGKIFDAAARDRDRVLARRSTRAARASA